MSKMTELVQSHDYLTPKIAEESGVSKFKFYKYIRENELEQVKLLLDDRSISLWSYNLETILAEKLQTILARGLLITRMRDFYDIKVLLSIYEKDIDNDVLKRAFDATCKKRGTERLKEEVPKIISTISDDAQLHKLWKSYQKKYPYAADISYSDVMESTKLLCLKM